MAQNNAGDPFLRLIGRVSDRVIVGLSAVAPYTAAFADWDEAFERDPDIQGLNPKERRKLRRAFERLGRQMAFRRSGRTVRNHETKGPLFASVPSGEMLDGADGRINRNSRVYKRADHLTAFDLDERGTWDGMAAATLRARATVEQEGARQLVLLTLADPQAKPVFKDVRERVYARLRAAGGEMFPL